MQIVSDLKIKLVYAHVVIREIAKRTKEMENGDRFK